MNSLKRAVTLCAGIFLFFSCNNDPEQTGCTDPHAANYNPRALESDNSCIYNNDEQVIWRDGKRGGWNGDLQEGAFSMEQCSGVIQELEYGVDSTSTDSVLYLGTGGDTFHKSYFSVINQRTAGDFAEGSLQMEMRSKSLEDGGAPEFIRIYICGKLADENACQLHRRSTFVEISTHSFSDSTFTDVNIPIRNFDEIMMERVNVVCGFEFEAPRSTGLDVKNIRWVANKLK